jgi:HlyD family secretion protein
VVLGAAACRDRDPAPVLRLSGHVEATQIRVSSEVGGRVIELRAEEGTRLQAGDTIARLDPTETELALQRTRAERDQADAQLRLLLAGARREEIRQADAQAAVAEAELGAARAELAAADVDLARFEELLQRNSGTRKQRDDAAARRAVAAERARSAEERVRAAHEAFLRTKAGARPEEIQAARARLAAVDAQLATLHEAREDATVLAPTAGVITEKLAEPGELVAPGTPVVVLTDLDRAWVNVYIDEPEVPRVRLGQPARVFTDAGGPAIPGTVSYISPRAEFTPRNVQTADERSKLVYRIKVTVDNKEGVLKPGMPVEAELAPATSPNAARDSRPGTGESSPASQPRDER